MKVHGGYRGDVPYQNNKEYLEAQVRVLDYLLYNRLLTRAQEQQNDAFLSAWKSGLQDSGILSQTLEACVAENQDRIELSVLAGKRLYLETILIAFEEKTFFRHMLILAFLWNMDRRYQRCLAVLTGQDCRELTLRDCMTFFCNGEAMDWYDAVSHDLWLLPIYFPEYKEYENAFLQSVCMDGRLVDYMTGRDYFYPAGVTIEKGETEIPLLAKEREWKLLSRIVMQEEKTDSLLILLVGERGAGKKQLLKQMAYQRQERFVLYTLESVSDGEHWEDVYTGIRYAAREAVLQCSVLALEHMEQFTEKQQRELIDYCRQKLLAYVREIYLLWDGEKLPIKDTESHCILFHTLTEEERFTVWRYYVEQDIYKDRFDEGIVFRNVANTFIMTAGQIKAALQCALRSAENGTVSEAELYQACYAQLDHKLAEKTIRVDTEFTLTDLKLGQKEKEVLWDICDCIRYRNVVMQQWSFQKVVPYGAGITVLFAGPPGTGKTMAAQVMANELHMELYKVDLSQVIDKYVGETEKNIRQIFAQAKKSNSVLFFDEADAIFNKRVEASGANERFANIESSLLLQCIEEYSGIAVLATNNYTAIDPAFIRRFKYYLLFREPDRQLRYEIWSSIFPEETPLAEEIDFMLLADLFELTGAVIKNVALSAAYLAAAKGRGVMLIDILKSIKRELYKNNLILTKEKLGSLGYLYDEL